MKLSELLDGYISSADFGALAKSSKKIYLHFLTKISKFSEGYSLKISEENSNQLSVSSDLLFMSNLINKFENVSSKIMARRTLIIAYNWAEKFGLIRIAQMSRLPRVVFNGRKKLAFNKEEIISMSRLLSDETYPSSLKPYIAEALLAFQTGMRPSEIERLEWKDIGETFIKVKSSKRREVGEVSRLCKVTEGVKVALEFAKVYSHSSGLVVASVMGKKLNKDTRSKAIALACRQLGIENKDFYSTRRGTATEMFKAGYGIVDIGKQLGHKNIQTTQRYLTPTMEESARKFNGF